MSEIYAGTAAGVDRAVFPLGGAALGRARLHRAPGRAWLCSWRKTEGPVGRVFFDLAENAPTSSHWH